MQKRTSQTQQRTQRPTVRRSPTQEQHGAPRREGQRTRTQAQRAQRSADQRTQQPEAQSRLQHAQTQRPQQGGLSRADKQFIMRMRMIGTYAFAAILAIGFFVGLLFFVRPTASTVEKRTLTEMPTLSSADFLDGGYFSQLSLWYSDTYPLREPMVQADLALQNLYGIQPQTMMVGGNQVSEEIPDIAEEEPAKATERAKKTYDVVDPPNEQTVQAAVQDQIMSGLYVKDGAAYSMYYFGQEAVDMFCDALATAAEELEGTADVYAILSPTNAAAMLTDEELASLGGADQRQALDYFYGMLGDKVTPVEALDTLRSHNDEYIFFRTDHHWTALGAYYVYEELCRQMGIQAVPLSAREEMQFSPFLGTFYSELYLDSMAANPDYVQAWVPAGTNDMHYIDQEGNEIDGQVITDVSDWAESAGYYCFIAGDKPLSTIKNPDIHDGSSVLLVKDSYGCAFAPFLVDNFETTYIIDYRYALGNIVDYVKQEGIQHVVFLNNISIAGTMGVAETMQSLV